jgi:hypothetical protein
VAGVARLVGHRVASATNKMLSQIQIMVEKHADDTRTGCMIKGVKSHIYGKEHLERKMSKE